MDACRYGGSEAGSLGLAIAIEELGKYDCSAGLMLLTTQLATTCIALAGTPAQKDRYLRGVAAGQLRGCFALTEPEAGSDAADITTTAIRDGDGYVLNGIKLWAGQATVADFAVVVAVIRPGAGAQGVSIFVVDLLHSGFRIVRELPKWGSWAFQWSRSTCTIVECQLQHLLEKRTRASASLCAT